MPHIAVKLWPGRSEEEKRAFARAVADDAARYLHADKAWVSVSIEEIEPRRGTRPSCVRKFWKSRTSSTSAARSEI